MRTKIGKRVLAGFTAFLLGTSTACQSSSAGSSESPSSDPEGASSADTSSETPSQSLPENRKEITVDFAERAGSPLVKKFGFFNSGLVSLDRTEKQIPAIEDLHAESMRVELGMGNQSMIFDRLVTGNSENMQFNWQDIDRFSQLLTSRGILPYFSYGYCPYPTREAGGDFRSQPNNLDTWKEITRSIASHFKENGVRIGYHEVWNEPDCNTTFYTGTWEEYCKLYAYGATGIREGDPDAVVGGPSTAWVNSPGTRYGDFLSYVEENNLPLDFFSMHRYGTDYLLKIDSVRQELEKAGARFETVPIHVNEINTDTAPWNYGEICDRYEMAADIFSVIQDLSAQHDVEVVSWAQFLESGVDALGVLNEKGRKKAAYNAFAIFGRMPVDQYPLESPSPMVRGMATADAHRACAVLWSDTFNDQAISVSFQNLPFAAGSVTVYRIDETNCSLGDAAGEELIPVETTETEEEKTFTWSGNLPPEGVLYIEINDGSNQSDLEPASPKNATIIRKEHYYPARGESCYAYFDETTWTARLGTGTAENPHSAVGVLADTLPDTLEVSFDTEGNPQKQDTESLLGIRVDYETEKGFTKSVLFHDGIYDEERKSTLPWGTKKAPTETVKTDLSSFQIPLAQYAPEDWNGRILLIFEMQNCGKNVSSVIRLR